jgi:hypothetical protein
MKYKAVGVRITMARIGKGKPRPVPDPTPTPVPGAPNFNFTSKTNAKLVGTLGGI